MSDASKWSRTTVSVSDSPLGILRDSAESRKTLIAARRASAGVNLDMVRFPCLIAQPVLELDARVTGKVFCVVRDQGNVERNCMCGDQLI